MTCYLQGRKLIFTILHLVSLIFKEMDYKVKIYSTLPFFLALIKSIICFFFFFSWITKVKCLTSDVGVGSTADLHL